MWTVPAEHGRICRSFTADPREHMAHDNTSNSDWGRCKGTKCGMHLV